MTYMNVIKTASTHKSIKYNITFPVTQYLSISIYNGTVSLKIGTLIFKYSHNIFQRIQEFNEFNSLWVVPFHCMKNPPVLGFQEVVREVEFADRPVVGLPGRSANSTARTTSCESMNIDQGVCCRLRKLRTLEVNSMEFPCCHEQSAF